MVPDSMDFFDSQVLQKRRKKNTLNESQLTAWLEKSSKFTTLSGTQQFKNPTCGSMDEKCCVYLTGTPKFSESLYLHNPCCQGQKICEILYFSTHADSWD